jgi:hypothetical protein
MDFGRGNGLEWNNGGTFIDYLSTIGVDLVMWSLLLILRGEFDDERVTVHVSASDFRLSFHHQQSIA